MAKRIAKPTRQERIEVTVAGDELYLIEAYRKASGRVSRAEAIRSLLLKGLAEDGIKAPVLAIVSALALTP